MQPPNRSGGSSLREAITIASRENPCHSLSPPKPSFEGRSALPTKNRTACAARHHTLSAALGVGTSSPASARVHLLADLQLVAYRNQVPIHLSTRRLGITPTQHGQQPPVAFNGGPRRFRTAAVTIVNGLQLTEAGEGGP